MKKYFAWVFFILAAVNVVGKGASYASGNISLLFDWPDGTINTLTFVGFVSLCLYFWNRWK